MSELLEKQHDVVTQASDTEENKENFSKRRKIRAARVDTKKECPRELRSRLIDCEARLRVKKIKEAIRQQDELHKKRMAVLDSEKKYWETKA
ncbi:hypothetical protein ABEB36_014774 [Hypothenemus hampei]|uniref:Uncharacterized protein n=1 Tax=Hypothenemus hampei TaxID=57062 RepID=A0ABD1E3T3_HYPHA